MIEFEQLNSRQQGRQTTYRVISTRYPPVDLYADLDVPPEDWEILHEIEGMTSSRLRDERGEDKIVPDEYRVEGEGAYYIMAPFAYINRDGSRFGDGTYGVYYCAGEEKTSLIEVAYHKEKFLRDGRVEAQTIVFQTIGAELNGECFDIFQEPWPWLVDGNYSMCQELGRYARERVDFLRYYSARHQGYTAFAVFRPRSLSNARHIRYREMNWDGGRITHVSGIDLEMP